MATVLKVRGTDVTSHIKYPTLRWEKDLDARVYLCSFTLKSTSPVVPANDDYVEATQTDGTTKCWTGIIRQPDEYRDLRGRLEYPVRAVGWAGLAKEIRLANSYTISAGTNDKYIVDTVLAIEYGQIASSVTHVTRARRASMPALFYPFGTFLFDFLEDVAASAFRSPWWIDDATKAVHWNDYRNFAPFAISNTPNGTTLRAHKGLARYEDHAAAPFRVRVYGTGISTTVTDWVAFGKAQRRLRDEPGSPSERYRALEDVNDFRLTTSADITARGFELLELAKGRRGYSVPTFSEGVYPGQLIDIIDTGATRLYTQHSTYRRRGRVPSSTPKIQTGLGRFIVKRVIARLVERDQWEYDVEVGDIDPIGGAAIGRAS